MYFNIDYIKEKSDDIIKKISYGNGEYDTEKLFKTAKEVLETEDLNKDQLYRITETVNQVLFMKKHAKGDTFVEFNVLDADELDDALNPNEDAASDLVSEIEKTASDYDSDFWYLKDELKKEAALDKAIQDHADLVKEASEYVDEEDNEEEGIEEPSRLSKRSEMVKKEGAYMAHLNNIEFGMKDLLAKHRGKEDQLLTKFATWMVDHIAEKEFLYEPTFDLMVKKAYIEPKGIWSDPNLLFEEDDDINEFKKLANEYYNAYNIFKELKKIKNEEN